jgi:hypothetical protein
MKSACLTEDGTFSQAAFGSPTNRVAFWSYLDGPGVFREGLPPDFNECFLE